MELHYQLDDTAFEAAFANATLDPSLFTHEAHLRLAWIHIQRHGIGQAIDNVCSQLRVFTKAAGAADKYNHTLTIAAVRAVYHFMLRFPGDNFPNFMVAAPRLKNNFRELIETHYSVNVFTDPGAKERYLDPDLMAFD